MDVCILIIEDSTLIVKTLTRILSRQGYEVESCAEGESGWNRLVAGAERQAPMPDLVLLDLNMPRVDGLTLLRRLRADERFALLPVVILTAETDANTRLTALKMGANDYLLKPIQSVELLARVETIVGWKLAERVQQRRMERLVDAGRILLSTLDLDNVLQRVMEIAMVELNVEDTSVWLRQPDGSLDCRAAFGTAAGRLVGMRIRSGQGIAGWSIQHRQSALISDAQNDPRFYPGMDARLDFYTRDIVTVPLLVRGVGVGVLQAINKKHESFSASDLAWIEVLAPLAAAAITSARLIEELQLRTTELEQRTVELQAHNKELDAFSHTVAHDLKSPVTSIVGYSSMLEETWDDLPEESLHICLRAITDGGHRISSIVDGLLLLAGLRKKAVEMSPLDTTKIVAEAIKRMSFTLNEDQAEIIVPESWPAAMGYGPWVEEVWVNYISNAVKYGGQPPRVELGADVVQVDDLPYARFWVRDNGIGISAEAQSQLFVPFTQLDQIEAEGYGLGLSIVQLIVTKLGGQVGLESEEGQGSVFYFSLPGAGG